MTFSKDYTTRHLIILVCVAIATLICVQLTKTDEGKEMYIEGGKVSQNAQEYEMDTTLQRYRNDVAFRAIVKAAEIRYNRYVSDSTIKTNFK